VTTASVDTEPYTLRAFTSEASYFTGVTDDPDQVPTLYRLRHGETDPTALDSAIPVPFEVWFADTTTLYLWTGNNLRGGDLRNTLLAMPTDGSSPAIAVPVALTATLFRLRHSQVGTTLHSSYGFDHWLYQLGPGLELARDPPMLLETECDWSDWHWSEGRLYAAPENRGPWLTHIPAPAIP
jgi:hypothetical protein